MMLSLHNLAKEYGILPSEALGKATTFDFRVLELAAKYENKRYNEAQGIKESPKLSEAEMLKMVQFAKGKNANGKSNT